MGSAVCLPGLPLLWLLATCVNRRWSQRNGVALRLPVARVMGNETHPLEHWWIHHVLFLAKPSAVVVR